MIQLPIFYSQLDPRWSNLLLGFNTLSQFNIYNYGCLIDNLSMIASYFGHQITPAEINELLKSNYCFMPGTGNYIWGSITRLFPDVTERKTDTPGPLTDGQMAEIKTALDNGYPVIFNIDYNPATVKPDFHYVLVVGYNPADENDFTIIDPIGGTKKSLKSYLGSWFPTVRKTVQQYAIYLGPKPKVAENAILVRIEDNERNIMKATQYDEICAYFKLDPTIMNSKQILKLIEDMASVMEEMRRKQEQSDKDLYNALRDLKRLEKNVNEVQTTTINNIQPLPVDPVIPATKPPVKPPVSYTDIQVQRESWLGKLLSFFETTAEEYAKLKRK